MLGFFGTVAPAFYSYLSLEYPAKANAFFTAWIAVIALSYPDSPLLIALRAFYSEVASLLVIANKLIALPSN
jgi:hypothetical protein